MVLLVRSVNRGHREFINAVSRSQPYSLMLICSTLFVLGELCPRPLARLHWLKKKTHITLVLRRAVKGEASSSSPSSFSSVLLLLLLLSDLCIHPLEDILWTNVTILPYTNRSSIVYRETTVIAPIRRCSGNNTSGIRQGYVLEVCLFDGPVW